MFTFYTEPDTVIVILITLQYNNTTTSNTTVHLIVITGKTVRPSGCTLVHKFVISNAMPMAMNMAWAMHKEGHLMIQLCL